MSRKLIGRTGAIATAAAMVLSSVAAAQEHHDYQKTMLAGETLLLQHVSQINLDCSPRGRIQVRVTSGPSSGTVRIVHRADYGHFSGDYERCNTVKVAGESVYYKPERGFTGSDSVAIDIFLPTGVEKTDSFTITVK